MKKILFFFLILSLFSTSFAQLDREHWFAPMVDRVGNQYQYQNLYLSTNRTTPFTVSIYNNNLVIGTVIISKNNPQKFDVLRNYIITTLQTDLFTPSTKGLYLKADFPFYANLRFSVQNHAEIITSKGIASTGKNFFAATAPITVSNSILNFMTSILATEDNTTVTVTGYKPTVQFSNGTTGAGNPTLTFTLNKGQSYIIDGNGINTGNFDGFIGAKITSTKPVNITNGNFNGQYAGNIPSSSDILMDQSVPVEQLGNQFVLVKGNGTIGSKMEGALIIATQDNTEIFLNNELTPTTTINTGQYYVVQDAKYISQGGNHFNLYIRTTKNAYVYQLLAGDASGTTEVATGGFNFIPALNCYLPKKIDELGLIDENFVYSNVNPNGLLNIPTKLNLITERGATVTVNGTTPLPITGPYDVLGNTNWVTYGIPNTRGTITINSTKAITAGITAGSDAVGYGGFFAGFPTQPVIIASGGTCAPGITLTVDPIIYETYQWYRNDVLIPGEVFPTFSPTQSGNYSCSVTMGSCAPLVTVKFKVLNCTKLTNTTYDICDTKVITPTFSTSTQAPVVSTVAIVTQPTIGTAVVNPATGAITYTPNNPANGGTDTFSYTFCGNDPNFPDCETVTVTINIRAITTTDVTLTRCWTNGQQTHGIFDLTTANVTNNTPVNITYYTSLITAQNEDPTGLIPVPNNHLATSGTIVYAVVKNSAGCKKIAQITLNLYPTINLLHFYNNIFCDDDFDGVIHVTLSDITPIILTNHTYFPVVKYYASLADAMNNSPNTLPNNWSYTTNTTIYVRVESPDGCGAVVAWVSFSFGPRIQLIRNSVSQDVCDDDFDGTKQVNLGQFNSQFTTDPLVAISYFNSLADAQSNTSPISGSLNITGTQTFYLRFEKAGVCAQVATLIITIKIPKKSDILVDKIICPHTTTTLDAGPGFDIYSWSTGATTQTVTNISAGSYWVDLTFNGCTYRQFVTVTESPAPVITSIDINGTTVTIGVSGGLPPYQYSLDGTNWQNSNVFTGMNSGNHTIYVKDSLNCEIVEKKFDIIKLINTITPNGDGHNDAIDYSYLMSKNNLEFRIFDRYGAEVFRGTPSNRYIWDGNIDGTPVPTQTYWYFISWTEFGNNTTVKYSSWLLVKHRNNNFWNK